MDSKKRIYLDIHILQTVPPSCVNRDDTGSPKTARYGGVTRARVSSQAWKRAVRLMFRDMFSKDEVGIRTKRVVELVKERITALKPDAEKPEKLAPLSIEIGKSVDKAVWEPYYAHGSIFVDRSSFYSVLNKIRMHVATTLISEEEQTVDAVLWTYMSTGVYVNGELSAEIKYPVYKPIESVRFTLSLQKGRNITR